MSNYDERVNDEADEHSRMMARKRASCDGLTNLVPHIRIPKLRPYIPEATNHSEQFNEE